MKNLMENLWALLPIIMVPWRPGGVPVIRNASYSGIKFLLVIGVVAVVVLFGLFMRFYHAHPVGGKIALALIILWCVLRVVGILRSLCDDPYTRIK